MTSRIASLRGSLALCAGLSLLFFAPGRSEAALPGPMVGTYTAEALERARAGLQELPQGSAHAWEDTEKMAEDRASFERPLLLNSTDDDACHYARGTTAIIHIFVNHTGGTWTSQQRNDMAARGRTAKDFYTDNAPAGANLRFDHEGSTFYYYYETTLNQNIPDSGMSSALMETVADAIGFSDSDADGSIIDDWSLYLMNWDGGFDNVILCFHPKQTGRAWASYGHAKTALYSDDTGNVFAHEWGHLFGACDEYTEGGECNGGIDCGNCQSTYLDDVIINGNCQLSGCPSDVSCVMINNTFSNICNYTLNHWGWFDEDNDGYLDWTRRRTTGNNFVEIYLIPHNGNALWNNTTDGYVIAQQWNTWSVAGLRSPSGTDYDLQLYGDNNHNYQLATSSYAGQTVDFVVSDYNHDRPGNEHLQVSLYSGNGSNNYRLNWESGTGILYPDGLVRSGTWVGYQVVRAWDVPLFGGETVTFSLDVTSGSTDFGMALFRSYGDVYHVGRSYAQWIRDAAGAGGTETYSYTVPADDVYGLIIFANNAADGEFDIKIGPTPYTLAEETPFNSGIDLRLYNYDPNAFSWSVAGVRPASGTNASIGLFSDQSYLNELAFSDDYAGLEFVAADYNPSYSTDYLRVIREAGDGTHRTEWEHDNDLLEAPFAGNWVATHVAKVWDCNLTGGQPYFFREYHTIGGSLDTGIYLFGSDDGNRYKGRNEYSQAANFRPASDGGEWFYYTPPLTDWYGFIQVVNDDSGGAYSVHMGPYYDLAEDEAVRSTNTMSYARADVGTSYWTIFACRPYFADNATITLYGDNGFSTNQVIATDGTNARVPFLVGDFNHNSAAAYYPRVQRTTGSQGYDIEWESGTESFTWSGTPIVSDRDFPVHDVADIYDLYVPAGQQLVIRVSDTNGQVDPGIALFRSNGGAYWANSTGAVVSSDATGTGGSEEVTYTFPASDWYGLVVWSKDDVDSPGTYRIEIFDPSSSSVDTEIAASFSLSSSSSNPFSASATLQYSLTRPGRADLTIFDPQGRLVRSLVSGVEQAGHHAVVWDGRDERGESVGSGMYFARLVTAEGERKIKMVRSN